MATVGNSLFAVTFGLLRQHMREQQQMWDIAAAFEVPPPPAMEEAEETDTRTMQLFPMCPGMTRSSQERPDAQVTAPLTISYKGQVLMSRNFSADKAKELMQLVGSLSTSQTSEKGTSAMPEKLVAIEASTEIDLPFARKVSLRRFLHKRKHRGNTTDPYYALEEDMATGKAMNDEPSASWLRL
ncbi:protein TIFY 11d-like [Phragmites australis]|uniref:protein TIFY 11d-like n=1 Tax=Phragmites australis TaxID=29695 RepID=UPI002D79B117|nr:protein TIFY 11d-like [Phragmites australis]